MRSATSVLSRVAVPAVLAFLAVSFLPSQGSAAPLVLLEDHRRVHLDVEICGPSCDDLDFVDEEETPFRPFASFIGRGLAPGHIAGQISVAKPMELRGSGNVIFDRGIRDLPPLEFWHAADSGTATSIYEVVFEVVAPTRIDLAGTLSVGFLGA